MQLARAAGSDDLVAEAMNVEVGVHQVRGDFAAGHALAEQALALARAPRIRGILLQGRGAMAARASDFEAAERDFAESVEAFRAADYPAGMAVALVNASAAACDRGDAARALELGRQAADVALPIEAYETLVLALQNQAQALVMLGRLDEAELMLGQTLGHFASTGNGLRQAECLEILGTLQARRESARDSALMCFRRALELGRAAGDRVLAQRLTDRLVALGISTDETRD